MLYAFVVLALVALAVTAPNDPAHAAQRRFVVAVQAIPNQAAFGDHLTFAGKVHPLAGGQSVRLQRHAPNGWKTLATRTLAADSTFTVNLAMQWPGSEQFRIVKPRKGSTQRGVSPTRSVEVGDPAWRDVSAGGTHSCGVRGTGTMYCWGEAFDSIDGSHVFKRPHQVGTATTWADVEVGIDHACALRTDGSLWCWGNNADHQLGGSSASLSLAPVRVGTATNWSAVAPLLSATCALRTDGTLWCWGYDYGGLLGDGGDAPHGDPRRVGGTNWATVTGGHSHTCATKTDGTAWCWGYNFAGAVGDGTTKTRTEPVRVGSSKAWSSLDGGAYYTCGLRVSGVAWCWGENTQGQLGDGSKKTRLKPVRVQGTWTQLATADEWTCGLRLNGTAACWGIAHGDTPASAGGDVDWLSLDLGTAHACGVRPDGSAWCFGENYYGQLGDGTTTRHLNAVPVVAPATGGYF